MVFPLEMFELEVFELEVFNDASVVLYKEDTEQREEYEAIPDQELPHIASQHERLSLSSSAEYLSLCDSVWLRPGVSISHWWRKVYNGQ